MYKIPVPILDHGREKLDGIWVSSSY
ncbi:uncharacterized protein METZ01_LOCUS81422 [marine metagenome]|uniref:Uncharacterized protein n=1 Tax=marine metagenome TaxID=408172 RepID=A0A381ULQ3_9ZZZZ